MSAKRSTIAPSDQFGQPKQGPKLMTIGWHEHPGDRYHVRLAAATVGVNMSQFMRKAVMVEVAKVLGREVAA